MNVKNMARSAIIALALISCLLIPELQCSPPLFLSAISSALATIPFTAGPMTMGAAGLVGAKLAVGSKLLYYLGFFGRRKAKAKPKPKGFPAASASFPMKQASGFGGGAQFPSGMAALPLPYALMGGGGGAFAPQQQFSGSAFPQQQFSGSAFPQQQFSDGAFPQQFGGAFPQQQFGGGFGASSQNMFDQQGQYGGFDPAQIYQALAAQGFDPMMAMQAMSGGGGGFDSGPAQFLGNLPQGPGTVGDQNPQNLAFDGNQASGGFGSMPQNIPLSIPQSSDNEVLPPGGVDSQDDVESFFTFLRDMDDNTCISRLICDIGADPSFLGEFSQNIDSIIGSLDVSPSSGAFQYASIMETGKKEGGCRERFVQCTDSAYEIVKSVAPSVGVPDNINSETVNQL